MPNIRGINNVNREMKKEVRGIRNVNRESKEDWRGVNGVNRKIFTDSLFEQYGTFGSQGNYQALVNRFVITVGSSVGEYLFGAVKVNRHITVGDLISVTWACTARYGDALYMDAVIQQGYGLAVAVQSTFQPVEQSLAVTTTYDSFTVGLAKTGGSNQLATLEVYKIKLNGQQLFP